MNANTRLLILTLFICTFCVCFSCSNARAMTKAELIEKVARSKSVPDGLSKKQVSAVVSAAFDTIKKAMAKGESFTYPGFGTFKKRTIRKRLVGRPSYKGSPIRIKAETTVSFKPAQSLKDFVGGKKK